MNTPADRSNSAAFDIDPNIDDAEDNLVSLEPDVIREDLMIKHSAIIETARKGIAGIERLDTATKSGIQDDETSQRVADMQNKLNKTSKSLEEIRKSEKAPFMNAGACVDGFFREFTDELTRGLRMCQSRQTSYLIEKQNRARQQAAEEQRIADERAREAEAAAALSGKDEDTENAIEQAKHAEAIASKSREVISEGARTRSSMGSVTSLRRTKKTKITDFSAVPREFLMVDEAKVKAHIRSWKDGEDQPIPGIEVFFEASAGVR